MDALRLSEIDEIPTMEGRDSLFAVHRRHLLFTYGTMQRGQRNHARLGRAEFVGEAETVRSVFNMLLRTTNSGDEAPVGVINGSMRLAGEVYRINGSTLHHIDMCEGHPKVYLRIATQVRLLSNRGVISAFIYLAPRYNPAGLQSGPSVHLDGDRLRYRP